MCADRGVRVGDGGITWAPLQASIYAALFRAWSDEADESSRASLERMLDQRVDLGLTRDPVGRLRYPLEIVPVVAIGEGPKSPNALPRLHAVQAALLRSAAGWPNLEVWTVRDSVSRGRLSPAASDPVAGG